MTETTEGIAWTFCITFACVFLTLSMIACSGAYPGPNMHGQWCATHTCDFAPGTFTADPNSEATVESAINNLNQRAGLALYAGPFGVPVHFQPEVIVDGESLCGVTQVGKFADEVISLDIYIATEHLDGCVPQWAVVRHEIACHALHPLAEHTASGMCSSTSQGTAAIDDVSMAAITAQD